MSGARLEEFGAGSARRGHASRLLTVAFLALGTGGARCTVAMGLRPVELQRLLPRTTTRGYHQSTPPCQARLLTSAPASASRPARLQMAVPPRQAARRPNAATAVKGGKGNGKGVQGSKGGATAAKRHERRQQIRSKEGPQCGPLCVGWHARLTVLIVWGVAVLVAARCPAAARKSSKAISQAR